MNIPKQCIFSGSTDNLNTCMTVTLSDGEKVQAWICDDFADSATPSKVKQAVIEFGQLQAGEQQEIDALMARAKELGLVLAPVQTADAPAPTSTPAPPAPGRPIAPPVLAEDFNPSNPDNRIIDGKTADSRHVQANVQGSATGLGSSVSGSGSEYAIASQDKPSEDLKAGEKAEIGMVRGRLGSQVAIAVKRQGKTGETKVSVISTGDDVGLQKRFKQLAEESLHGEPHDFIHAGYQVKTVNCGLCKGSGRVMGGKECPKCGGAGSYDV